MCGGRARCSTCRVQVAAGEDCCPAAAGDEQATLHRIGAAGDVRLACQLRPSGNISVVPLVRTALPVYRPPARPHSAERDVVVVFCDFLNREELARDGMPQDLLYLLKLYGERLGDVIRAAGGTLANVGPDGLFALFGIDHEPARAARHALAAAGEIERVISDLDNRLGREAHRTLRIAVSIHAGRAAVAEIGASDPPSFIAVGEAVDAANELRKLADAHGALFAISEPVTTAAGVDPAIGEKIVLRPASAAPIAASLAASPPLLPPSRPRLAGSRKGGNSA